MVGDASAYMAFRVYVLWLMIDYVYDTTERRGRESWCFEYLEVTRRDKDQAA